jgi:hypothetical protein
MDLADGSVLELYTEPATATEFLKKDTVPLMLPVAFIADENDRLRGRSGISKRT